jgi:methionine synthase I (cobalamin-dependent)
VATTTIALKNAAVVMNTTVDLSDQVQSVTLTVGFDQLETTAMGASGRSYTKGLQSVDVTMMLFNSYGAAEVEASLHDVVGDDAVTLEIYPDGTSPGASNPEYTITGAFLSNFTPVTGTVGELSMVSVTFTGGTWARATA